MAAVKLRFRTCTLLTVVTALAVPMGWYATNLAAYSAEQRLLTQLQPPHGHLSVIDSSYCPQCAFGEVAFAVREPTTAVARALSRINPPVFERVTRVTLMDRAYDDRALDIVSQFPQLAEFDCTYTSITAASVTSFRKAKPHVKVTYERTANIDVNITSLKGDPNDPFDVSATAP